MVNRVFLTSTFATGFQVTWTCNNLNCNSYRVEYQLTNKEQCHPITGATRITSGDAITKTFFTLTSLLPHSTYQVFVTPENAVIERYAYTTTSQAGKSYK